MKTRFAKVIKKKLYVIDVDNRLLPDDNFRNTFYDYFTLSDVAKHIVANLNKGFKFVEGVGEEGEYNPESKTGGFKVLFCEDLDVML
jgi:hypothetical protein